MSKKKDDVDFKLLCTQAEIAKQALERKLNTITKDNSELQEKILEYEHQLHQERSRIDCDRADRFDVTNDMQRQFRAMQEQLLKDIDEREKNIEQIKTANAKEKDILTTDLDAKTKLITEKEAEVGSLKKRLDQLSREFSAILRETLAQIADKIENKADDVGV